MGGSEINGSRLLAIFWTSRIHALAARALICAVCNYRLFNFESESVQVFGCPGEHFSLTIGNKIT
jgi:hypothetical protein